MTYSYKNYEFTAFTEADFLGQGGNGSSIGRGDTFTMPGSATVTMSTWDNDSKLSGDCRDNATDKSGQKATVDGARVGSQMYAESYHVLKGSDGKTYYMIEIEVEGYNAPGAGDDFFTFYGRVPPAGVELTVVQTCNVKGCWVDFRCLGAGDTAPTNEAPTFTNLPENGILCVDENATFVIDIAASDADGDTLTYEIVGGVDAAAFEIDPETGELSFKAGPDYEAPTDADGNNVYDVTVKVSDGKGGEEIKPLWIKVKDVAESTPGGTCIVVEAEDMQLCGYRIEHNANASGDTLIKGSACKWGVAKTTFDGPADTYDLKLTVLDENDGQGRICVNVNGKWVLDVRLDQDNGGNGVHNSTFRELVIEDIDLKPGDVVKIYGIGNKCEFARIDKLEFCSEGDPMTAELGDTVWFDTNKDGIQNNGEVGAAGVTVLLKDANGTTMDQTVTDGNGNYTFTELAAGDYKVCVVAPAAYAFTGQNAGSDDAADSDVMANGMSDVVTLAEGESNLTVDAGLIDLNTDPEPQADTAKFCADQQKTIDILANDTDADFDALSVLSIADADEIVFAGGSLTLESGAIVTLNADGTVAYDANGAHDALLVGNMAVEETITYAVSDGNGGTGSSTLDITVCGTESTLEMICDALPDQVTLNIAFEGVQYEINVIDDATTSADDGLASATWTGACIDLYGQMILDQDLQVNVYGLCEELPDGLIANPENLDQINWIINQGFVGQDTMDGSTQYTIFDVQEAVWVLSDGTSTSNASANEIVTKAAAGEGFVSGEGDLVAVVFDPISPDETLYPDTQTFIMGVAWDALALDCIC